ncbi:type I-F CRISPR-associated protein Csy2 [Pragia fontium]|uniref:CRISPR-associated protein Csy2 n=1 Tax=Pragia fontium DSM 5563 = ATCC 49100 TaxID=1122977 RepID=A0AAJ4W934_9GAMM|nr:type I-F CRISPR-associated protein Csy2 [Pragia fontium]SFC42452.1 CRISPR-associated protein Csy2 [Pragia fontium DSM 5563 = ATCC 49100]
MKYYLVIPHIKIQNANCISSPLTYGFPAITAFTGAVHALSRKLTETFDVKLEGVAIAAHRCDVQRSRPNNYASDWSFIQSRHPIKKDGNSPSIIEEGYAHLDVSLVIEVIGDMDWNPQEKQLFCDAVYLQLMQQRLAGGSVLSIGTAQRRIQLHNDPKGDNEAIKAIKIQISPSFLLMDSQQALIKHTKKLQAKHPDKTALDALIDLCSIHVHPESVGDARDDISKGNVTWTMSSEKNGWLVPIPVGYKGIAPEFGANQVADIRAPQYPTHFVETVYSVGEWRFTYKVNDFNTIFWRHHTDLDNQLFLVSQSSANDENLQTLF